MSSRNDPIDSRLVVGAIYVIIFLRPQIDDSRSYHWGIYHHITAKQGNKYHIKNFSLGWIADHAAASNFMKSIFLVGLVRVGHCHPDYPHYVKAIVESFPLNQVPPGYNVLDYRTWTMHMVRLLIQAGYVRCRDVNALDREVIEWAERQFEDASNNVQPRSIIDSRMCTFARAASGERSDCFADHAIFNAGLEGTVQ